MHLSFISTRGQQGLDAPPVTVEVHLSAGLPAFQVVGLGESRSREIRSRVRAALISSHLKWPDFNITVNLTPGERVTPGTRFDLPIAIGLLVASQQLPRDAIEGREFIGELGLDGCLKPSRGDLAGNDIVELCALSKTTRASLIEALTALNVSARSAHRRLRVARTLADMEGEERVSMSHINTALSFREAPTGVGAV